MRGHYALLVALFLFLYSPPLGAQVAPGRRAEEEVQRYRMERVEKEVRTALEARRELGQRLLYDYGGWDRINYITYDDLANNLRERKTRTLRYNDFRMWVSLNVDGVHYMYARAKAEYTDYIHHSQYQGRREDDFNFDQDQVFYNLSINGALSRYFGVEFPVPLRLELQGGRFFSTLGNGLSYYRLAEGVELRGYSRYVNFKTFWFRTPRGETNIDYSAPSYRVEGQDRKFLGVELSHPGFHRQKPYFYFLKQSDDTDAKDPVLPIQKYNYDSYYMGLGAKGEIIRNLTYEVEGVKEWGKSYNQVDLLNPKQSRADIKAWAFNGQIRNIFKVLTRPNLSAQYAVGTGDRDRGAGNVTTTIFSGNFPGTRDRNFLYFGYIDTGYNLAPRLSNLKMTRLGISLKPMDFTKRYKDSLELGLDYYSFHRHKRRAGISDFRADRPIGNVGKELDTYLNAKVTSDLFITINYGKFYPGNAYSDNTPRDYVLVSASLQF